ncbi:hypothetical protein [Sphaerisporangium perillae]|uniref:hypothetical protein n=1 Tax=Sphaerisporangium perillae TaxID=2935860 RepID=UPI0035574F48
MSSRRLKYSIGFNRTDDICAAILALPEEVCQVAYDADRQPRDGAWIAELTGMLDLSSWPKGMRVIVGKERPHPGAQLRFTDIELRQRHRAAEPATGSSGSQRGRRGQVASRQGENPERSHPSGASLVPESGDQAGDGARQGQAECGGALPGP